MTMPDQMSPRTARRVRVAAVGVVVGAALSGALVTAPATAAPYPPVPPTVSVGGGGIPATVPPQIAPGNGLAVPAEQPYRGGIAVDASSFPVQAQTGSGPATESYDAVVPFALIGLGVTAAAAAGVVASRRRRA